MAHTISQDTGCIDGGAKTWTIRKIDPQTITATKKAAQKMGMKIGPWVDVQLTKAADAALEFNEGAEMHQEFEALVKKVDRSLAYAPDESLVASNRDQSEVCQLILKRCEEITNVIKGQNEILQILAQMHVDNKNL